MASIPGHVNENEIAQARLIADLWAPSVPFEQKSGCETWTVAFAPDGSYFAWSQGHRVVKLVPWSQCQNKFCIDEYNNTGNKSHQKQNSDARKNAAAEHIIDCGDIVWALAFGSSVPGKRSRCVNIEWHRFKFGRDQLLLATGLSNGRIKIWDVYTGKFLLNLMDHTEVVRDLTFAPDGSLILVSASRDKTLRVWDLKDDGNMVTILKGHNNWVYCCAFSPDSNILCSVGAGKAISHSMYHSWQRVGRRPAPWPLTMLPEGVFEMPRITYLLAFSLTLPQWEVIGFSLVLPQTTWCKIWKAAWRNPSVNLCC